MQSTGSLSLQVHKLYAYYYYAAGQKCFSQIVDKCVFRQLLWHTGGWNQEKKKLRKATVVPNEYANAQNLGEGRVCAKFVQQLHVLCPVQSTSVSFCKLLSNAVLQYRSAYLIWRRAKC